MREDFITVYEEYYIGGGQLNAPFFFQYYLESGKGTITDLNEFIKVFRRWVQIGGVELVNNIMSYLCTEFEVTLIKKGDQVIKVL